MPSSNPGIDLPNPGIESRSPALRADSLLTEPPGSPKILEWVAYPFSKGSSYPQDLNQGLLHCRWILYQLSYQGSPIIAFFYPQIQPTFLSLIFLSPFFLLLFPSPNSPYSTPIYCCVLCQGPCCHLQGYLGKR